MSAAESMPSENCPQRDEAALDSARPQTPLDDPASPEATAEIEPAPSAALARRDLLLAARARGIDLPLSVARVLTPIVEVQLATLKHLDRRLEIVAEEARERRENREAMEAFVAEAALEDAECRYGDTRHLIPVSRLTRGDGFCSDKHRALYQTKAVRVVAGYRAYDDARETEIFRRQAEVRAEFEEAAERALVELGRPWLDRRRRLLRAAEASIRSALERATERRAGLEAAAAAVAGRTPAERATLDKALADAKTREAKLAAQLPRAERRRLRLERAWARWWLDEGDRRRRAISTPPARYCPVNEATLADEGDEFCSAQCQRRWKKVDFRGAWGRLCAWCQRWFKSAAPRVPVYADTVLYEDGWPQLVELDVCSAACWAMCRAAQEIAPTFPPAEYLGPPPPFTSGARQGVVKDAPGEHQQAAARPVAEDRGDAPVEPGHLTPGRTELSEMKTKIMNVITAEPGLTTGEIRKRVGKKLSVVRSALSELFAEGRLIREGRGRRGSPDRFRLPPVDSPTSQNPTENRFPGNESAGSESGTEFPL